MIKKIIIKIKKKLKLTDDIKEYRKQGVTIGNNCNIYNSYLDPGHAYLIEIGNNVTITNSTILTHDASTQIYLKKSKVGKVIIEDNTFIGWGSIILPNTRIGKNCIIGAGSVVTKDIPDNSVASGSPAKVIGSTDDFINKHKSNLKEKPVFNTNWRRKTAEEKNKEREQLKNTYGYDE